MGSPTPFLAGPAQLNPETRTDPPQMCPSKSKRELKTGPRGHRTRLEASGVCVWRGDTPPRRVPQYFL